MEKTAAVLFKGDEVLLDNFVIRLNKEIRDSGLFLIYVTTARPPTRLKVLHEENIQHKTIGDSPLRINGQSGDGK